MLRVLPVAMSVALLTFLSSTVSAAGDAEERFPAFISQAHTGISRLNSMAGSPLTAPLSRCINGGEAYPYRSLCIDVSYRVTGTNAVTVDSVRSCVAPGAIFTLTTELIVEPHIWNMGQFVWSRRSPSLKWGPGFFGDAQCDTVFPNITLRRGEGNGVWTTAEGYQYDAMSQSECYPIYAGSACNVVYLDRVWVGFDRLS